MPGDGSVDLYGSSAASDSQGVAEKAKSGGIFNCCGRSEENAVPKVPNPDLEDDVKAAQEHMWQTSCTKLDGSRWSVWRTTPFNLAVYGEGIQLYFMFLRIFGIIFFVTALLAIPSLYWNLSGDALVAFGYEGPSKTADRLAKTTIANLGTVSGLVTINGTTTGTRKVGSFDIRDITFIMGVLDAVTIFIVYLAALFLELVIVPAVVRQQKAECVTPDAFTLFVDCLPRRLEDHATYAEQLKTHFEVLLKARLEWNNTKIGQTVVASDDIGIPSGVPELRWCGRRYCPRRSTGRDKKGRRLGSIEDRYKHQARVLWKYMPALEDQEVPIEIDAVEDSVEKMSVTPAGTCGDILDAALLNHLEDADCDPQEHELDEPLIHSLCLVWDFEGHLGQLREELEKEKKEAEVAEIQVTAEELSLSQKMEASHKLAEAHLDIDCVGDTLLEDRDVVGAFVTFSRCKHRDFIADLYRFSSGWCLRRCMHIRTNFKGRPPRVRETCPPSDIFWENLDYPEWRRKLRLVVTVFACLIVMAVCIGFFSAAAQANKTAASYGKGMDCSAKPQPQECECIQAGATKVYQDIPSGIYERCEDWLQTKLKAWSLTAAASIMVTVTNFVIGQLVAALGHFPKPTTESDLGLAVMLITALMQMLNLGFIVVLVNAKYPLSILGDGIFGLIGAGEYLDLDPEWYSMVGSSILLTMCVNAVFPVLGSLQVLTFWCQRRRGVKEYMLRSEIFEVFTPPPFLFASRHAEILVSITNVLVFASALPLLWVFGFLAMVIFFYTDKFTLFYGSHTPPRYAHDLMKYASLWLQSICWWHCAFAIWVFGNSQSAPSHCPRCEGDSMFLGLIDISDPEKELSTLEKNWFDGTHVSYMTDRLCKTSSVPNVIVLVTISVINLLRFLVFVFGRGVAGGVKEIVEVARNTRATAARFTTARTDKTEASQQPRTFRASLVGVGEAIAGATVHASQAAGGNIVGGFERISAAAGFEETSHWKKYLNPWAVERAAIFDEPFAKKPLQQMQRNKVFYSYDLRDALKMTEDDRNGRGARESLLQQKAMQEQGLDQEPQLEPGQADRSENVSLLEAESFSLSHGELLAPVPAVLGNSVEDSSSVGAGEDVSRKSTDTDKSTDTTKITAPKPAKKKPKSSAKRSATMKSKAKASPHDSTTHTR